MTPRQQSIMDCLKRGAILSTGQVAERLRMTPSAASKALTRMREKGHLVQWKAHHKDREYLWATDDPKFPTIKDV